MSDTHEPSRAIGSERDSKGWFLPGNVTCRRGGNPNLRHASRLQRAIRRAATPQQMREVLDHLHKLAMAGDSQAARLWLERVAGRPRETPTSVLIDLPALTNAADITEAMRRVVAGVAAGDLALDEAAQVVSLVRCVADATVLEVVERRVAELESRNHR